MSIPKIYILDDEPYARQRLIDLLKDISEECPTECIGAHGVPKEALSEMQKNVPDILLLDMHMPTVNGLEFAQRVHHAIKPAPAIIFITAHDQYALQAFEAQAFDYLLKPVRSQRLAQAIMRGFAMNQSIIHASKKNPTQRSHILVQEKNQIISLGIEQITYCQADTKYVTLYTAECTYLTNETLTQLENEFPDYFLRIHRNCLVARHLVNQAKKVYSEQTESWHLSLKDVPETLPISRRQWPSVKTWLQSIGKSPTE